MSSSTFSRLKSLCDVHISLFTLQYHQGNLSNYFHRRVLTLEGDARCDSPYFFVKSWAFFETELETGKSRFRTCSGMYSQCLNTNLSFVRMFGSFSISIAYYFVYLFISPFRIRIMYFFIQLTEEISSMTSRYNMTPYVFNSIQECVDLSLVIVLLRQFIHKISTMEQVYM